MEYDINNVLSIGSEQYRIIGKILYKNTEDGCSWHEYRMLSSSRQEVWLSCDDQYQEYSLSFLNGHAPDSSYHQVDQGTEKVVNAWGDVDVDIGEKARFFEYEDSTEENIISLEQWSDGNEYSYGYYIHAEDIALEQDNGQSDNNDYNNGFSNNNGYNRDNDNPYRSNSDNPYRSNGQYNNSSTAGYQANGQKKSGSLVNKTGLVIAMSAAVVLIFGFFLIKNVVASEKSIAKYIEGNSSFTYVTSITGEDKQKADVYQSANDKDATAKLLIDFLEGDVTGVQQNTEDGDDSIAILSKDEYCLVYTTESDEVYVQVSSRKYAYTSDQELYNARPSAYRYYRRYYYTMGFGSDSSTYRSSNSSYSSFDDSTVNSSSADTYSGYASSVRQSSVNSRKSSGGGLSNGK